MRYENQFGEWIERFEDGRYELGMDNLTFRSMGPTVSDSEDALRVTLNGHLAEWFDECSLEGFEVVG